MLFGVSDGHIFFDFSNYCPFAVADANSLCILMSLFKKAFKTNLMLLFCMIRFAVAASLYFCRQNIGKFHKCEITSDCFGH